MKKQLAKDKSAFKIVAIPTSTSASYLTTASTDIMAPALLSAKGKSESQKASMKSSKQNIKKMDPEEVTESQQQPVLNLKELKEKVDFEDQFICSLLANIPSHGMAVHDQEEESVETEETEGGDKEPSDLIVNRVSNPDELKERLAAKLSQFQGKKLDFSGKKMKMKLKKKLDRLEKKKLKRKNNKMKSKIAKLAQETKAATVKAEAPEPVVQSRPPKPIFNSEGRMVFSKFDFGELTAPTPILKKTGTNDPKAALHKIKKFKEKLEVLESKGEVEKVQRIQEQQAWDGALQRAEGVKVKDKEEMLVKSIKRKEQKKKQSQKKWEERIQAQEKRKEDAQKKRKTNIKERAVKKKEKKLDRMAKKGRIILK